MIATKESPEGVLTTRQIAQQKGRGEQWVRKRLLRPLLEAGKIESVPVVTERIDGIVTTIRGYRKIDGTASAAAVENPKEVFND